MVLRVFLLICVWLGNSIASDWVDDYTTEKILYEYDHEEARGARVQQYSPERQPEALWRRRYLPKGAQRLPAERTAIPPYFLLNCFVGLSLFDGDKNRK